MVGGCHLRQISFEGFPALELANGQIALIVVPALGAKVASLVHVPYGKEWLWRNPYLDYRPPAYGASYIGEFDLGGLDECFPSVGPALYPSGPWSGTQVPDHGELWSQGAEIIDTRTSPDEIVLTTAWFGARFPYRFERTIVLHRDETSLRLDYKVSNLSSFEFPFVWSIHPLLSLEAGMRLMLPPAVTEVRIDFSTYEWCGAPGTIQPWPLLTDREGQSVDLSRIQPPSFRRGVKFFTLPMQGSEPVETVLADKHGERSFRFRFVPDEISHIGVWVNCAGWTPLDQPPYYNLALEPCIGGSDSLVVATDRWGDQGLLPAKGERTWALELRLT